jgi:hypothetical protein
MSNLTYTLADLKAAAKNAAGITDASVEFDTGNASADLVNDAIQLLANEHPWSWLRRPLILSVTATANASASRTSNVVTFTSNAHGLLAGDWIRITGSTDADGEFFVGSVTTNTFTVNSTGTAGALAAGGSWIPGFVALPADFSGLVTIQRNSQVRTMSPCSGDRLLRYRTAGGVVMAGPTGYRYAIRQTPQTGVTATPTKRLELYPAPTEAEAAAFAGEYRRFVPKVSGSTDVPDVGIECHAALRRLCRAMALSSEEERGGEDWRLYERQLQQLKERDGGESDILGALEGGVDDCDLGVDGLYPTRISPA